MSSINVAIIGAGQISKLHAEAFQKDERVQVRAVCDVRQDVAIRQALEWGAEDYYLNYQDVLRDPNIHVVSVLTPHHQHASIVLEALKAGKHVQVARPVSLTLAEVDQIIQESESQGLTVSICEPVFFNPVLSEMGAFLESGEIGNPISVRFRVGVGAPEGGWSIRPESWLWRFDPQKCGGGPFLFDAVHEAFVVSMQLLGKVETVQAWIGRTEIYPGYFVDAPATMMWTFPRKIGCIGSLELTYSPEMYIKSDYYPNHISMEVTGTRGMLRARLSPARIMDQAPLEMFRDGRQFKFSELEVPWNTLFEHSTRDFIDAIVEHRKPRCSAQAAREHLKLTLAARDSSLSQRVHRLG